MSAPLPLLDTSRYQASILASILGTLAAIPLSNSLANNYICRAGDMEGIIALADAFKHMPKLQAILNKHADCLLPSDHGSSGSISVLRAGAVSKVHTGQFNVRLRLHYPLMAPSAGPELAGAERSYGNAWSRGVFLIDDAQLHKKLR